MSAPKHLAIRRIWGNALTRTGELARVRLIDLLIVVGLAGLFFGLTQVAGEWTGHIRPTVEIDLSPSALPRYAFFSFSRGLFAYVLSFGFTLVYGYWAAKDRTAERVLVPLLDVLQSIPVLGFMPGVVLSLVALFPTSNIGLELAAVIMIFTGQAWNMTFSFYHSVRSVPRDMAEVAELYRFTFWQRFRGVELPFAATGLVWNSMMSVAGGWFFLMINEAFVLGDKDFRLPGLGSYMSVAAAHGDKRSMLWAMLAMATMIVCLDQLVFRPLVVWARRFRFEEGSAIDPTSSWFFDLIRRSRLLEAARRLARRIAPPPAARARRAPDLAPRSPHPVARRLSTALLGILVLLLAFGASRLLQLLRAVPFDEWISLLGAGALTLGRVLLSTLIGTLWALPAGLAIGLLPRVARVLSPVAEILASFPAPILFPAVIAALASAHVPLGWGSVALMLLGTQWYILFNVVAGASAVPSDLREAAKSYRLRPLQRFTGLYFPAVFPYLVTGWVTAAGGAWNASIVAEFVTWRGQVYRTAGLGAEISGAAERADFPVLAAAVAVMSIIVVAWNGVAWRACYHLAETRFSLEK